MSGGHACFFCGELSEKCCEFCSDDIYYCSEFHRRCHRPNKTCFPFRVVKSETRGLHLIASRDIRAVETIFEEMPSFVGPYVRSKRQCVECFTLVEK